MPKILTKFQVEPGVQKVVQEPVILESLPLGPGKKSELESILAISGNAQINLSNRSIIEIEPDGTVKFVDQAEIPQLSFASIKTQTLHADQILTVGDADGWRVELSGVSADYPIRYWNGETTKFSLDKEGNLVISGTITASEIHIPSATADDSFHVDEDGNAWWGCSVADWEDDHENADAYILKTGVIKGSNFRTSESGKRIMMQSDILAAYDSSGKTRFHIDPPYLKWGDEGGNVVAYTEGGKHATADVDKLLLRTNTSPSAQLILYSGDGDSVEQVIYSKGHLVPLNSNSYRLGVNSNQWKRLYLSEYLLFDYESDCYIMAINNAGSIYTRIKLIANGGNIEFARNITGLADNTYDLGSNSKYFRTSYFYKLKLKGLASDPSGAQGLVIFNTTTGRFRGYDGDSWRDLCFYDERND